MKQFFNDGKNLFIIKAAIIDENGPKRNITAFPVSAQWGHLP
jgi:hypothetical protein